MRVNKWIIVVEEQSRLLCFYSQHNQIFVLCAEIGVDKLKIKILNSHVWYYVSFWHDDIYFFTAFVKCLQMHIEEKKIQTYLPG